MKGIFPQYYRPSQDEIETLFDECIFIFDANMLLNLYRYPRKASEDLLKILQRIAELGRLWLPFQAALEYQDNRLGVIADQKRKFGQVKEVISDIQGELKKKLDKLQLKKRHSIIDPDILVNEIEAAFQKYISQLEEFEKDQLDVYQEDQIRVEVDKIFGGKIGTPFTQDELNKIFNEGSTRYKAKQPPGYSDEDDKKGSYAFHGNLVIKREFGDLIIWKEIINFINRDNPRSVVLTTGENKEDWWLKISGKTIGPRPELLSEIYSMTTVSAFYMYNSDRFMEVASRYFGVAVDKESIKQVKLVSQGPRPSHLPRRRRELHIIYNGKCQVCGFDEEVNVTHIRPRNRDGVSSLSNLVLLCPNHQSMFVHGAFSIDDNFQLIGLSGMLTVHPQHKINLDSLKFHRENIFKS